MTEKTYKWKQSVVVYYVVHRKLKSFLEGWIFPNPSPLMHNDLDIQSTEQSPLTTQATSPPPPQSFKYNQ